jgi:hypothetical protein
MIFFIFPARVKNQHSLMENSIDAFTRYGHKSLQNYAYKLEKNFSQNIGLKIA